MMNQSHTWRLQLPLKKKSECFPAKSLVRIMSMSKSVLGSQEVDMMTSLKQAINKKKYQEAADRAQMLAQNLDQQQDQPGDEKDEGEQLGEKLLTTGKFKGKTFREVYLHQKEYLAWIRQNVSPAEPKFSINMLELRMYIESRDTVKRDRMMKQMMVEKFSKERTSATRRTATESSWDEVMEAEHVIVEEKQVITLTEMQQYRTYLENLESKIQQAMDEKSKIEMKLQELMKMAEK